MNNQVTLTEAVEGVMRCLEEKGYTEFTLNNIRHTYNGLLKLASQRNETFLTDELTALFLADNKSPRTGQYKHERFLEHNRCIRFLRSYLETGQATIEKYQPPEVLTISDGLLEALNAYDQSEKMSGLSESSLARDRRPIRYLLEYMTSLGYQQLSDIRPGDTINAIESMLTNHYAPTSLVTALSGMRRFYEMFPDLQPFRMEIPSRLPRKRTIIDVYSEEEQEKILKYLLSPAVSKRDAAICLISFETGLRNVDICNLRLGDVDWKHNTIHIVQSKTKKPLNLPLRSSYGNAMAGYLLEERPSSSLDYIFLSTKAPHVKLKNTWHIVKPVLIGAGIDINDRLIGTRMFRHNAASAMLRKGVPLPAISEELGHSSQDSTMVYLSTDQKTLSSLTLPLPEGGYKE